jgi:hypothetical protein
MDNEQIRYLANRITSKRLSEVVNLMLLLSTLSLAIGTTLWIAPSSF